MIKKTTETMERCKHCEAEFAKSPQTCYCPHCGRLLEGSEEFVAIDKKSLDDLKKGLVAPEGYVYIDDDEAKRNITAYNSMIKDGYAPAGKILVPEEEHDRLCKSKKALEEWEMTFRDKVVERDVNHFTWDFYGIVFLVGLFVIFTGIGLFVFTDFLIDKFSGTPTAETVKIVKDDASGKYGIYDNRGDSLAIPYEYDSISHRKGRDHYQGDWNFFYLYKNGQLGVADSLGRLTYSCDLGLDSVLRACHGVLVVCNDGKQGLMDGYGHQILPIKYQYVLWENRHTYSTLEHPGTYVGNIIPAKPDRNRGWELYDRSGKKISSQQYKAAIQTGDPRLIKVSENRNDYKTYYGIVDETGQVVLPCIYHGISNFGNGRAWVRKSSNEPWTLITSKGERLATLSSAAYTPSEFSDSMAAVKNYDNTFGYCDMSGKLVIPMIYEQVRIDGNKSYGNDFYSGKARVSYKGKSGYIDKTGKFTPDSDTQ